MTKLAGRARELELLLEPSRGDSRTTGKRVPRFDPGCAVVVGEAVNALAHDVDGDVVDNASEDGVEMHGHEEIADVVYGMLGDEAEWDGGAWDRPEGFQVPAAGRNIVGSCLVWDDDD